MDQVGKNGELLDTARDCLHFVTTFFDPISVSAAHIYHSALELSPLSSIVRRLYYHRWCNRFPRVVTGIADQWDHSITISGASHYMSCTWSPCGRFVAATSGRGVDIRDALSSELVFTITEPDVHVTCAPAYSPDGRSITYFSETLTILDIQTGGATKIDLCDQTRGRLIVWSLDGGTIATVLQHRDSTSYGVRTSDVASGAMRSLDYLQSSDKPHLWAHDGSFRIMATGWKGSDVVTIEIFEFGFNLTKIESFQIRVDQPEPQVKSFSPTTYRISIWSYDRLCIRDARNSKCLLNEEGSFYSHVFSSDGSLFAASTSSRVCIWKHTSDLYTLWREFPFENPFLVGDSSPQFPLTSSSIMCCSRGFLRVFHLDSPPIIVRNAPLAVLSPCGTYMATAHKLERTVVITNFSFTNFSSQTASQFIDTDMEIRSLALTGNILLVLDIDVIAAWRLTKEGLVDGVSGGRRAGRSNSIWTVLGSRYSGFTLNGQIVIIVSGISIHAYHTETGEVLEPPQMHTHTHDYQYHFQAMYFGQHYLHHHEVGREVPSKGNWQVSWVTLREGWVKDPEGKRRLWIPVEWRDPPYGAGWLSNITTLRLNLADERAIIIMF